MEAKLIEIRDRMILSIWSEDHADQLGTRILSHPPEDAWEWSL
jgi:hypothetical protein